jgi:hypothetical protein
VTVELVRGVSGVLNPDTGEVLALETAATVELAAARAALSELDTQRKAAARMVDDELVRRTDESIRTGELTAYTFDCGSYVVSVDTGATMKYDSNALRKELVRLAQAGELPITERAVERTFTVRDYYLLLREWRNLERRWPELRVIAERHCHQARRYVRVAARPVVDGTAEEVAA